MSSWTREFLSVLQILRFFFFDYARQRETKTSSAITEVFGCKIGMSANVPLHIPYKEKMYPYCEP